jgi:hypothetical protein
MRGFDAGMSRFNVEPSREYPDFLRKCKELKDRVSSQYRSMHLNYLALEKCECDLRQLKLSFERLKSAGDGPTADSDYAEKALRQCEVYIAHFAQRVLEAHIAGDEILDCNRARRRTLTDPSAFRWRVPLASRLPLNP